MRSVWTTGAIQGGPRASLHGSQGTDTTVIGGGITGLTVALLLADAGHRVAVVEAMRVGQGCTGGSTGNLYGTVSKQLSPLRNKWDADTLRKVATLRMQALDLIESTVDRFSMACDFTRRPMYLAIDAPDQTQEAKLEAEYRESVAAGLEASLVGDIPGLPLPVHRALKLERQAQFNPLRYVQGLADAVVAQGGVIYENSRVCDVDAGRGLVTTVDGELRTRNIVYATHTPKGINLLQSAMEPYREYGVAARIQTATSDLANTGQLQAGEPDAQYLPGIFWMLGRSRSVRFHDHEGQRYLVVVGEKHKTGEGSLGQDYYKRLQDYARAHFPVGEFEYRWSAQQYSPADGLPYIGRSAHDNVYLATGFSSDGLTWGTVAARAISGLICGTGDTVADIFSPRRFTPLKSARSWFKENMAVAGHLARDYLAPAEVRDVDQVAPGQGKIVEIKGEKLAVYRAETGSLSALSPVCPHLKCMVNWNPADSTWDCPCHGSRFDVDGCVIEGPAYEGLASRTLSSHPPPTDA